MKLIKTSPRTTTQWLVGASAALLIVAMAYTPKPAFALPAGDQVAVVGTYALITTFVGHAVQQGGLVEGGEKSIDNCPGANLAVLTIFRDPAGGSAKVVDYYDVESYDALTCDKNDPATDLSTNNADTSLTSDLVNKAGIEKAILNSLEGEGWKLVDSYVTWRPSDHKEGNERALESETYLRPTSGALHWGWSASDLEFYGAVNSSPYGRFLSVDGGKNDPTPDDTSVVNRPIHIKFYRLYDQGCNLQDSDVQNKDKVICNYENQDGSKTSRTLAQLSDDVRAASEGTFVYGGDTAATAGGSTAIKGGCSIAQGGGGANQMLWALLAIPAFVLLRRRLFAAKTR